MDHPSHTPGSNSSLRQFASAVIAVAGILASFLRPSDLPPDVLVALSIAGVAIVAWFSGRQLAILLSVIWIAVRWAASADQSGSAVGSLAIHWGVMAGLVCGINRLQTRWEAEHRLARLDALTGLPNRQAFFERCAAELSRNRRFGRPLTLALLDGDGFKSVNDRWGHAAGDRALQITAQALAQTVRNYDFVGRLGGDEFVILFPETGPADAERAVQRLQQALRAEFERQYLPLTYTIGVVSFSAADWDVAACLKETDRVLYRAKRAGKGTAGFETAGSANGAKER
jgi:diguanylate cyclase (GGDEF)-like protein